MVRPNTLDAMPRAKEPVLWPPLLQVPGRPIEVFFSYAHRDEALRDELAKHLRLLERQGIITRWHDRRITGGTEWAGAIDEHLRTAQIILLLISADFLASDYCYDVEVRRAMDRHEAGEARVVPIILRPWIGTVRRLASCKPAQRWPCGHELAQSG